MVELINYYDLDGNFAGTMDRKQFYKEQTLFYKEHNKFEYKVPTIRCFLLRSDGKIILQKRSNQKLDNPGLFDKSFGGHVIAGNSFNTTLMKESIEELGNAAYIVHANEFKNIVKTIDLNVAAVVKEVDYVENFVSVRIKKNGDKIIQPFMSAIYIGYYDGPVRFSDNESMGVEMLSLDELKNELKENPGKFTKDVELMIEAYSRFLVPFDQI
jgi:isopentenyldiphosphate isomerase